MSIYFDFITYYYFKKNCLLRWMSFIKINFGERRTEHLEV